MNPLQGMYVKLADGHKAPIHRVRYQVEVDGELRWIEEDEVVELRPEHEQTPATVADMVNLVLEAASYPPDSDPRDTGEDG